MITEEGKARIDVPVVDTVSKDMDVFYNPVMKLNRDVSVLLLDSVCRGGLGVGLPLAATGVRGIRFLLELKKNKIKEVHFNDYNKNFKRIIKNNLELNKKNFTSQNSLEENGLGKRIMIKNQDANLFLLNSTGFDYIDIDPFGTPVPFLESSVKRISRNGILAVTATDTSALCGTYPKACLRKYWAVPLRNELMHEVGLRILIRKVQLIGAQYEKAFIPIFSYSKDHYMRVFFRCEKGKTGVDKVLGQHDCFEGAGPMWLGRLWDKTLVNKMYKLINNKNFDNNKELIKFLGIVKEECKINTIGFYDLHKIVKRKKIRRIPRTLDLIKKIRKLGYKASETHFSEVGVRSDIKLKRLLDVISR